MRCAPKQMSPSSKHPGDACPITRRSHRRRRSIITKAAFSDSLPRRLLEALMMRYPAFPNVTPLSIDEC